MTLEQEARDLLERMGIEGAQGMPAGSLVELANLIAENKRLQSRTTGWEGYGWKDGQYVDALQEYFNS